MNTSQSKIVLCEMTETGIESLQSYSPFCLEVHRALGATGLEYSSKRGTPDYLDRVDAATFPGRPEVAFAGGLTATRGHDMTGAPACPSPIPTHAQA